MEWAEELPPQCPPADAIPPENKTFYRLVSSNPPAEEDFWSQRQLKPHASFRTDECMARAVSLFSSKDSCAAVRLLPAHRGKNEVVMEILLTDGSGVVKPTFKQNHYSWWRTREYLPEKYAVVA